MSKYYVVKVELLIECENENIAHDIIENAIEDNMMKINFMQDYSIENIEELITE